MSTPGEPDTISFGRPVEPPEVGAFQAGAVADTTPPTATLNAPNVTAANAASLNPYTFTLTFTDSVAVAHDTVDGASVEVVLPDGADIVDAALALLFMTVVLTVLLLGLRAALRARRSATPTALESPYVATGTR